MEVTGLKIATVGRAVYKRPAPTP